MKIETEDKMQSKANHAQLTSQKSNDVDSSGDDKRRKVLASVTGVGLFAALPSKWQKPILNTVVLPAHADTSPEFDPAPPSPPPPPPEDPMPEDGCVGGFETEPIEEPIVVTVTASEINGPIIVSRTDPLSFDGFELVNTSTECATNQTFTEEITFTGTIDSANNQIAGTFLLRQFCGEQLVCEQITDYLVTQDVAVAGDDLGAYSGTATGTLTCCVDFL